MIGYVTIGTHDMDKAKAFYGELLAPLGARIVVDMGRLALYGNAPGKPITFSPFGSCVRRCSEAIDESAHKSDRPLPRRRSKRFNNSASKSELVHDSLVLHPFP